MKGTKTLVEMTSSELRDEIGRLRTVLEKTVAKNKRRRKALKDLNKHAIMAAKYNRDTFEIKMALAGENNVLRKRVLIAEERAAKAEELYHRQFRDPRDVLTVRSSTSLTAGQAVVEEKQGFFSRLIHGRRVRGASGT